MGAGGYYSEPALLPKSFGEIERRVQKKRPELWENGFILHHDNVPSHTALSVKQFLARKGIPTLEHPPYSPDLAPCDFFLFPKVKSVLKGTHFESMKAVKEKTAQVLNQLTKADLQHAFQQ